MIIFNIRTQYKMPFQQSELRLEQQHTAECPILFASEIKNYEPTQTCKIRLLLTDEEQNTVFFVPVTKRRDRLDSSHCSFPGAVPQKFTQYAQIKNCLTEKLDAPCSDS